MLNSNISQSGQSFGYNLVELMEHVSFGDLVKNKRSLANLTQEGLAKNADIAKSYVSTIETSRPHSVTGAISQPARDVVIRIVEALNKALKTQGEKLIDLNQALILAGYAPQETEETGWFKGLEKLSPDDRKRAKRQIRALIDSYLEEIEENGDDDEDFKYL